MYYSNIIQNMKYTHTNSRAVCICVCVCGGGGGGGAPSGSDAVEEGEHLDDCIPEH